MEFLLNELPKSKLAETRAVLNYFWKPEAIAEYASNAIIERNHESVRGYYRKQFYVKCKDGWMAAITSEGHEFFYKMKKSGNCVPYFSRKAEDRMKLPEPQIKIGNFKVAKLHQFCSFILIFDNANGTSVKLMKPQKLLITDIHRKKDTKKINKSTL